MKLREVVKEDATASNDYQQMQDFVRANRVQGVPPEQQIALALFKELQKQKQQNNRLSSELSDAEKRIDQATQSNELQSQELGMHATELERERKSGEQQKSEVGKLGQAYAEREQASKDQIEELTSKLEAVKSMPGVNKDVAEQLENQIKELAEKGMPADRVQELEQSIAEIQGLQVADDKMIKDLVDQVKDAHNTAAELKKTKEELGGYINQATQTADQQIALMQQQLAYLNQLSNQLNIAVTDVIPGSLENIQAKVDELDGENEMVYDELQKHDALLNQLSGTPAPEPAPAPVSNVRALPRPNPPQIAQQLIRSGDLQSVAESKMFKAIQWATGKTK